MQLSWFPYTLQFRHPFTVASFSRTTTPIVIVKIVCDQEIGFGEASMPPYLGESQESVISFLSKVDLSNYTYPFNVDVILNYIDGIDVGNNAAKAAIDIALHDLIGKIENKRIVDYLNIKEKNPISSFTIGIDTVEKVVEKVKEGINFGFKFLKIKLGTKYDKSIINAISQISNLPFSVDANQGWSDKYYALDLIEWLKEKGAVYVEQPFDKFKIEDTSWLSERASLPIIADESVRRLEDLELIKNVFNGINIKLMKSTGINEAMRMIKKARALNMRIVIGCMSESSCAISAAASIASLADWVDLDGPYLITNDCFEGAKILEGRVIVGNKKGIGINFLSK